jgi:hypothetical protein
MNKVVVEELQALDRVVDMLGEHSFLYLSDSDSLFAAFLEDIYDKVSEQQAELQCRLQTN